MLQSFGRFTSYHIYRYFNFQNCVNCIFKKPLRCGATKTWLCLQTVKHFACGGTQHLAFEVILSPTQLAVDMTALWVIITGPELIPLAALCLLLSLSSVLRLNISDSDMLTITDGDEVTTRILGRYVGGSSPFKLSSTTPDLTVTFHSDPAGLVFGKGEGFIINYMGESSNCTTEAYSQLIGREYKEVWLNG